MNIRIKQSTKPERILADCLIRNKIPFKFREVIAGKEVDFVIGRVIVEVDGRIHRRKVAKDISKNEMLVGLGYIPLHFSAKELTDIQKVFKELKSLLESNNK
jgi:very-short-patch-repair endonuclease